MQLTAAFLTGFEGAPRCSFLMKEETHNHKCSFVIAVGALYVSVQRVRSEKLRLRRGELGLMFPSARCTNALVRPLCTRALGACAASPHVRLQRCPSVLNKVR